MMQLLMQLPDTRKSAPFGPASRIATPSDVPALASLLARAFGDETWTPQRVHEALLDDPTVTEVRVIDGEGGLVATASARRVDRFAGQGYVHWVAAAPDQAGRGLGRGIVSHIVDRFARDGMASVVLETDDARLAAISAYLGLGFVPQYPEASHAARWSAVFVGLGAARARKGGAG